jgi:hypothetical protein
MSIRTFGRMPTWWTLRGGRFLYGLLIRRFGVELGLPRRSKVVKKSIADVRLSIQIFALGLLRNMKQSTMYSCSAMVQVLNTLSQFGSLL